MTSRLRPPWASLLLIAANIALAFWVLADPSLAERYGFRADDPTAVTLFASLFVHVNTLHLLANMVFLAAVGPMVELATGAVRFLLLYFVAGVIGAVAHAFVFASAPGALPLVGASGCIAGCVGYCSIRYMRHTVFVAPNVRVPLLAMVFVWLGLQVAGMFIHLGDADGGEAFVAHLGGFLVGVVFAALLRAPQDAARLIALEVLGRAERLGPDAERIAVESYLNAYPEDDAIRLRKAVLLEAMGEVDAAADELTVVLAAPRPAQLEPAVAGLARLDGLARLPAVRRLRLAASTQEPTIARTLLRSVVDEPNGEQAPEALLALAEVERTAGDSEAAAALLTDLVSRFPLHPATEVARGRGLLP